MTTILRKRNIGTDLIHYSDVHKSHLRALSNLIIDKESKQQANPMP